ncbi:MAG: M20 family metallopeptidase, partial [Clostridiales bacterium]|nr:M20 family metallopeptidase [Clostridiales bacterium]
MDKELMIKLDERIDELKDDMIRDFQSLLRMRSVYEGKSEEGKPFGPEIYECLQEALRMGERLGLKSDNVDGYAGVLSAGEGEKSIGVLCHLDVVPEGSGWDFDPYGGEISGGKIYGRGALDDKGPAIAAMYALKALVDCGVPLKKRVEIILGCDEESGMRCLEYYKKHREIPEMSFSPDGEFPVTNSEKSISTSVWRCEYESGIKFKSGTVHNAVPGDAVALVPYIKPDKIEALLDKVEELSGCKLKVEAEG